MNRIVAMMKWGKGYPASDFNRLARVLRDVSGDDFEIVCVTDDPTGLAEGIRAIELPEIPIKRENWVPQMWPKIALFSKEMFNSDDAVLFMDVDVIVLEDVSPFFDLIEGTPGLWSCPEWDPTPLRHLPASIRYDRGANTSVFGFVGGTQDQIWQKLHEYGQSAVTSFRQEQKFVTKYSRNLHYWPQPMTVSFKRHCVPLPPMNFFSKFPHPKGAKIVCFQGHPQIEELIGDNESRWWGQSLKFGMGPVAWVKDYCKKYRN